MQLSDIIVILFCHFVGDFIMQTDRIAQQKGSSNLVLWLHVLTYMLPVMVGGFMLRGLDANVMVWVCTNGLLHFGQDYLTVRLNKKLKERSNHWFFVGIGADQFFHYWILLATYQYIFQP